MRAQHCSSERHPAGLTGDGGLKGFEWTRVMILDMSTSTITLVHVGLSLIGIVSGLIVLFGILGAKKLAGWTGHFHIVERRTREFCVPNIFKRPRLPRATCS